MSGFGYNYKYYNTPQKSAIRQSDNSKCRL